MDYCINEYRDWISSNAALTDAFSEGGLRNLTLCLFMGRNYRTIAEHNTKSRQALTHLWLSDITDSARAEFGTEWRKELLNDLASIQRKTAEQKYLQLWLNGLADKTRKNLDIKISDLPEFLNTIEQQLHTLLASINREDDIDRAWLLMMAGSATLSIRGSEKAKIGKKLEQVFLKSALRIIGLEENVNFWMNLDRDEIADRETDAEVEISRGRIRIEMGLIAEGNQEVTEDKINRVGENGVVIFDKVGTRSRIHETAARRRVKLIQIRHSNPLQELYNHLFPLTRVELIRPPETEEEITNTVSNLESTIFH